MNKSTKIIKFPKYSTMGIFTALGFFSSNGVDTKNMGNKFYFQMLNEAGVYEIEEVPYCNAKFHQTECGRKLGFYVDSSLERTPSRPMIELKALQELVRIVNNSGVSDLIFELELIEISDYQQKGFNSIYKSDRT